MCVNDDSRQPADAYFFEVQGHFPNTGSYAPCYFSFQLDIEIVLWVPAVFEAERAATFSI